GIRHSGDWGNGSEWSPADKPDASLAIRGKAFFQSYRSAGQLGDAEAKKRLFELWHRSIAKSEKPQRWAIFSKLDKRKKAASTAGRGTLTSLARFSRFLGNYLPLEKLFESSAHRHPFVFSGLRRH